MKMCFESLVARLGNTNLAYEVRLSEHLWLVQVILMTKLIFGQNDKDGITANFKRDLLWHLRKDIGSVWLNTLNFCNFVLKLFYFSLVKDRIFYLHLNNLTRQRQKADFATTELPDHATGLVYGTFNVQLNALHRQVRVRQVQRPANGWLVETLCWKKSTMLI